jgi:hypothetical protein
MKNWEGVTFAYQILLVAINFDRTRAAERNKKGRLKIYSVQLRSASPQKMFQVKWHTNIQALHIAFNINITHRF